MGVFATDALAALPTGIADSMSSGMDVALEGVSKVTTTITSNWILWLSLSFGILGLGISFFRRLRTRK